MAGVVFKPQRLPLVALTALLAVTWLALAPRTPDLAAAVYRAGLFAREGFQLYDAAWYGGHHLLGYSLVFPELASVIGARPTGVLAAILSTFLFERLAVGWWGPRGRAAAACYALAVIGDLMIGRLTFSLGVAVGLASLLALQRGRPRLAAALAVACSITSPVAGMFLALAAAAVWLANREKRAPLGVLGGSLAAALVLAVAFPDGGVDPTFTVTFLAVVGFSTMVAVLVGPRERVIRIGAVLYALAGVAAFVVPTPMGGNISRLGADFGLPLLVGAVLARPKEERLRPLALAAAFVALGAWTWLGPVREVVKGIGDPSFSANYYKPLIEFLGRHNKPIAGRLEVPFTRGHWESVYMARRFPLARGWETQLDVKYNGLFYRRTVNLSSYGAWLRRNAVAYVALPDAPMDKSSRAEARLVRSGLPYLREIWRSQHWRVYRVLGARPMVSGPARLTRLGSTGFVLAAHRRAPALVRLRWTPYWTVVTGGCVERTPGGWTRVTPSRPGRVVVSTKFSIARMVGGDRHCDSVARRGADSAS